MSRSSTCDSTYVQLPKLYGWRSLTGTFQDGLTRYKIRIYIAFGLIVTTFIALLMTIYLSCRPFNHYWQISPDPGNSCQAAVSKPIIWVMFIGNVMTDVYLFIIPLPMLWQSSLKTYKKLAATLVLSGGILIVVCAILKSVFVLIVSPKS